MKQKHRLLVLFLKTLYISAFTFGGGFVIVTFMKKCFVDELHWIDEQEMLDFTALAQSCPGAIAVNGAILVGWKVYGFAGMVVAVIGTILPPMAILKEKKLSSFAIMVIAFLADFVLDVNVIYIIAAGILAGTIRFIWMRKREQTAGTV